MDACTFQPNIKKTIERTASKESRPPTPRGVDHLLKWGEDKNKKLAENLLAADSTIKSARKMGLQDIEKSADRMFQSALYYDKKRKQDQIKELESISFKPKISEKSKEIVRIRDKKAVDCETENNQYPAVKNQAHKYVQVTIGNTDCKLTIKKPACKQAVQSKPKLNQVVSPQKIPLNSHNVTESLKNVYQNRSRSKNKTDSIQSKAHQESGSEGYHKKPMNGLKNLSEGVQYHEITYEDGGLQLNDYNDTIDLMR